MYVITGATGHTGRVVAEKLLDRGLKVRVLGRDATRLDPFTRRGAEAFTADMADAGALAKAFSGATAVYAMIPPNIASQDVPAYSARVSDALANAIKTTGVKHAVVLSSFGADKPAGTGPVVGLHNLEQKLEAIGGLNALFLRAGYFMENLLAQVGIIQALGITGSPVRGDLPLPLIATHDIGVTAAEALSKLDFTGKQRRELQGARDVTYMEVAKIIGSAIHKPDLVYQQLPPAQVKPSLVQMGMSPSMADQILELADALNTGHIKMHEPRSANNTTPTRIETFVEQVFVPAYRGKAAIA